MALVPNVAVNEGPLFAEVDMGADASAPTIRATVVQAATIFYDTPATLGQSRFLFLFIFLFFSVSSCSATWVTELRGIEKILDGFSVSFRFAPFFLFLFLVHPVEF